MDEIIEMKVVKYIFKKDHNGRRGSPAVKAGTEVYALQYETGGYFTYSYLNEADALACIQGGINHETNTRRYMEWNYVNTPENTRHVGKRKW